MSIKYSPDMIMYAFRNDFDLKYLPGIGDNITINLKKHSIVSAKDLQIRLWIEYLKNWSMKDVEKWVKDNFNKKYPKNIEFNLKSSVEALLSLKPLFRICSWNIGKGDEDHIITKLLDTCDILFLQEVGEGKQVKHEDFHSACIPQCQNAIYRGLRYYIRISDNIKHKEVDLNCKKCKDLYQAINVCVKNMHFLVVNIYLPSGKKKETNIMRDNMLNELRDSIKCRNYDNVIIMGDFNIRTWDIHKLLGNYHVLTTFTPTFSKKGRSNPDITPAFSKKGCSNPDNIAYRGNFLVDNVFTTIIEKPDHYPLHAYIFSQPSNNDEVAEEVKEVL